MTQIAFNIMQTAYKVVLKSFKQTI